MFFSWKHTCEDRNIKEKIIKSVKDYHGYGKMKIKFFLWFCFLYYVSRKEKYEDYRGTMRSQSHRYIFIGKLVFSEKNHFIKYNGFIISHWDYWVISLSMVLISILYSIYSGGNFIDCIGSLFFLLIICFFYFVWSKEHNKIYLKLITRWFNQIVENED